MSSLLVTRADVTLTTKAAEGPVRWEAPEAWEVPKRYNKKSDVWSYGVALYEMFVRKHPYEHLESNTQVGLQVSKGYRLEVPDQNALGQPIPPLIKSIMQRCWESEGARRPSMAQIVTALTTNTPLPAVDEVLAMLCDGVCVDGL